MCDILVLSRMVRKTQVFPEKIEQILEGDEGERESPAVRTVRARALTLNKEQQKAGWLDSLSERWEVGDGGDGGAWVFLLGIT